MLTLDLNINLMGIKHMEKNIYFYSSIVMVDGCKTKTVSGTWDYISEEDGDKYGLMREITKHVQEEDNETVVLTALNEI